MCYVAVALVAATVISAAATAYSSYSSGQAAKKQSEYQSQIAANNAVVQQRNQTLATQNAAYAEQAGVQTEAENIRRTRALIGTQRATAAANGLDLNSGGTVDDLTRSSGELGALGNAQIRDDAGRRALGFRIQAANAGSAADDATTSASMYRAAGDNAVAQGNIGSVAAIGNGVAKGITGYGDLAATGSKFSGMKVAA